MQRDGKQTIDPQIQAGFITTTSAFLFWGIAVMYWKLLKHVPALELISHRILWSFGFVLLLLLVSGNFRQYGSVLRDRRKVLLLLISALFLGANWLTFVWAVNAGYVVECSLGYFINPLVNVILGLLVFREKLRPGQILSVVIATVGVLNLTLNFGRFPWIALLLAGTFGTYGMLHKKMQIDSLPALGIETLFLLPLALTVILVREIGPSGAFLHAGLRSSILLMVAGAVTATPLLLFNHGVRRLRLSTVGLIHYLTPTCMFLLGVFFYREPFGRAQLISYILIWLALLIFSLEGIRHHRQQLRSQRSEKGAGRE